MTVFRAYRFQLCQRKMHNLFHANPWKGLDNAHRQVSVAQIMDFLPKRNFDRCVRKLHFRRF